MGALAVRRGGRVPRGAAYRANDQTGQLRQTITDCDAKIERYRAALDAGGGWVALHP